MLTAKILATATATVKHKSLEGQRLVLVQPYAADGSTPDGEPVLVVDTLGAARGTEVIITSDGHHSRQVVGSETTPIRWTVLGLRDA